MKQSIDTQWCNRDISNYFYEGKENTVHLIKRETF